jgi:O-antigen/teichoic acid export membrane protein
MIRDIATVMRGTVIAQAIGFAALPILSRMFVPEAFGHYQLFISLLTLLLVFPTLRYEVALLRANSPREFRALAQLCLFLALAVTATLGLLLGVLDLVGWPPQIRDLPFPIWLLIAATLFGGFGQLLNILATREKSFGTIANSKILQSATYAGTGLTLGATAPIPTGLILADVVGRVGHTAWLGLWSRRAVAGLWRPVGRTSLIAVARRYREYPFISTPGTAINVLGGILTPVMIYASFSPAVAGQYALIDRSVNLPLGLVIISIGQVFTAQFSAELRRDANAAAAHFRRVLGYMGLLALGPLIVLIAAGPWLFTFVFGAEWQTAGELSRILAPAYASSLLSGPVHMVLTVMGHQKLQTAWEVSRLVLVVGLWTLVPRLDLSLDTAVAVYSGILVACNVGFVCLSYAMVRRAARRHSSRLSTESP